MSWLTKLYQTYSQAEALDLSMAERIMPIYHTPQNAHIHITLSSDGNFLKAEAVKESIILPATEKSASRSSGEAPHPLADKIQYVAQDYPDYGGKKKAYFDGYKALLGSWVNSPQSHPKAVAVYRYIEKGQVVADLVSAGICHLGTEGDLLHSWDADSSAPELFKVLPKTKGQIEQGDALICWSVEVPGDPCAETWKDESLQQAWIDFDISRNEQKALCLVSGEEKAAAVNHPAKLRHTGDKAKLISSNDSSGYTYRGRFYNSEQAANISFEVTQKAHNALRWLIDRQGHRNGDQVIVAWAVSGEPIPEPFQDIDDWDDWDDEDYSLQSPDQSDVSGKDTDRSDSQSNVDGASDQAGSIDHTLDLGGSFAHQLQQKLKGYRSASKLKADDSIVVMALDSATPGRMGIVYYRDFQPQQYLDHLEAWHNDFAWWQRASKEKREHGKPDWYLCAPSAWSILQAVYGDIIKSNESLKKNLSERLLPCITEKRPIPLDIMRRAVQRASNRVAFKQDEQWLWEQNLGVACALYRGYQARQHGRKITMALETDNCSRDYLYGRLLAVADNIEQFALDKAGEKRMTNAGRLMQRFADRPFSTWKNIEMSLQPYLQRLQSSSGGFVSDRKQKLDEIHYLFDSEAFTNDKALTAEFLLGFHSQRLELLKSKSDKDTDSKADAAATP